MVPIVRHAQAIIFCHLPCGQVGLDDLVGEALNRVTGPVLKGGGDDVDVISEAVEADGRVLLHQLDDAGPVQLLPLKHLVRGVTPILNVLEHNQKVVGVNFAV